MMTTIVKYLIIKGIDFQYFNNSIECAFRYDLPYDFKSLTQLIAIYMNPKNDYSFFSTIVCKLVEKNVPFIFQNKAIHLDYRENINIDSIAPFGDKIIITTPNKDFLILDSINDLASFHAFFTF